MFVFSTHSCPICIALAFVLYMFVTEGGKILELSLQSLQFLSSYMTSSNKASLKDKRYLLLNITFWQDKGYQVAHLTTWVIGWYTGYLPCQFPFVFCSAHFSLFLVLHFDRFLFSIFLLQSVMVTYIHNDQTVTQLYPVKCWAPNFYCNGFG